MTDPKAHEIIAGVIGDSLGEQPEVMANAVVGALAVGGFAIVEVDAAVVRRVLAEMSKERESKR